MNRKVFALCLVILTLICVSSASALGYTFTDGCNVIVNENKFTVSFDKGDSVTLDKNCFFEAGDFDSIRIIELPDRADGTLMLKNREVNLYERINKNKLSSLKFVAAKDFDGNAYFCFKAISGTNESPNYQLCIVKGAGKETATLETLNINTLPSISSVGYLFKDESSATCNITKEPKLGEVSVSADGYYVYKPFAKSGEDSFDYEVLDTNGNIIAVGSVSITIEKTKSALTFADMEGRRAHLASVKLVESGAMESKTIAGLNFFDPTLSMTRSDFLVTLMKAAYDGEVDSVVSTSMEDDDTISATSKGYVETAYTCGIMDGIIETDSPVFAPTATVTRAEAFVMAYNISGLDASETGNLSFADSDAIPDWAYHQICALYEAGIISGYDDNTLRVENNITREEAAELIYNVAEYIKATSQESFWESLDVFNLFR